MQKTSLPPHLVDHRLLYAALKTVSILPCPLDHFVHMVLFFHCANDDDEPVLHHTERKRLDVV